MTKEYYKQMIADFERKAEAGDSKAMKLLGDLFYQGPDGNGKNISLALPWWQKATDHGEYSLAPKVAYAYLNGDGCEENYKLALYYYQMAADNTYDTESQYCIGLCYENGVGCHTNKKKAISYYELAALSGHAQAQWRLGSLLLMAKKSDGFHWLCCAHLSGVQDATQVLFSTASKDLIQYEINEIKRYGIDRYGRKHEYNRELSIFLSVLKWGTIGFFSGLLALVVVCGFILHMEHFPNLIFVLIVGLFGYLGYWWETN